MSAAFEITEWEMFVGVVSVSELECADTLFENAGDPRSLSIFAVAKNNEGFRIIGRITIEEYTAHAKADIATSAALLMEEGGHP